MNRTLKNLYANYRYFGYMAMLNFKQFLKFDGINDYDKAERYENLADGYVKKYELLKQIMIER